MTDIEEDLSDPESMTEEPEPAGDHRISNEQEKRLRRELTRLREQTRQAQNERDAIIANAHRDRDIAVAQVRDEAKNRIVRSELKVHAVKAGILDLDGLRLADTGNVAIDDAGEVVGAEEAIAHLKANKPYLFGTSGASEPAVMRQLHRAPAPATPRVVDARTLSKEEWQSERARLIGKH